MFFKSFWELLKAFTIAVFISIALKTYAFQLCIVESGSMEPTLFKQDVVLLNIMAYKLTLPKRGDIVVFKLPDRNEFLIKRVIGLPGEIILIANGQVFINGIPLEEPYIYSSSITDLGPFRIPQGKYFVMGDSRHNSEDSRIWGPIDLRNILGRADFVVFPPKLLVSYKPRFLIRISQNAEH